MWELLRNNLKRLESVEAFKSKIKGWIPENCPCRICKPYIYQVGFIQIHLNRFESIYLIYLYQIIGQLTLISLLFCYLIILFFCIICMMHFNLSTENEQIINNNNINQNPVLCPYTNKTNEHLNILANLQANSLLCRPTLIRNVPQSRLKKDAMTNLPTINYMLFDLTKVSSVRKGTSTCLMYDSCHDKINYHFIELCF